VTEPGNEPLELIRVDGTAPLQRFLTEHGRIVHFVGFVSGLAMRSDEVRKHATEALRSSYERTGDEPEKSIERFDEKRGALAELRRQSQLLLQMTLVRGVENYLAYLSELLALLFEGRPETMRAKLDEGVQRRGDQPESVPLDLVLEHETMEDLIGSLVERRVTNLSNRGLYELASYLSGKLGFDLHDATRLREITRAVEFRNLIVHNRAVVNRAFLRRLPDEDMGLGDQLELDVESVFKVLSMLATELADVDERAIRKWQLPASPLGEDNLALLSTSL
jgi:hypothetical protein